MTTFHIADWEKHYETAETRKLENLRWVPTPNRHDGLGFRRLASHRDRCELFTAWTLMVQIASRGGKGERGALARDGHPLNAEDLAMMTGFPVGIFDKALEFFSHPKQGWLAATRSADDPSASASAIGQPSGSPEVPAESPARPASPPARPGLSPAEWKGREGIEGNGKNGMEGKGVPPQGGKTVLQVRAEKLHRKRESTPWDRSEAAAWKTAEPAVNETTEQEWAMLEAFYTAPQATTYARTSLETTLNNWSGEIQRARQWSENSANGSAGTNPHQRSAPTAEDHHRDGFK